MQIVSTSLRIGFTAVRIVSTAWLIVCATVRIVSAGILIGFTAPLIVCSAGRVVFGAGGIVSEPFADVPASLLNDPAARRRLAGYH